MAQTIELADFPIREIFLKNNQDTLIGLTVYQDSQLANQTIREVVPHIDELDLIILFIQRGSVTIRKNILFVHDLNVVLECFSYHFFCAVQQELVAFLKAGMVDGRTFTIANSTATKNPVSKMSSAINNNFTIIRNPSPLF